MTSQEFSGAAAGSSRQDQACEEIRLLAETSNLLASCTDYAATIKMVAGLLVSSLAVWCAVDLVDKDGKIRREAVVHRDPRKASLAETILLRYHAKPTAKRGVYRAIETGQSILIPELSDTDWAERSDTAEHLRIIRELGSTSYMCVPLIARSRVVGAIMLLSDERTYGARDLQTAEKVARKIALAVDNVQMFQRLEQALKTRDDFFAVLSHELKTPISVIHGWTKMLRTRGADPKIVERALSVIERNVRLQTRLIDDLLDASCISAGKVRIEVKEIDFVSVLMSAVDSIMPTAAEKNLSVESRIGCERVELSGDSTNLERMLGNLLVNAVKFTPSGGKIVVALHVDENDAVVTVTDTGIGIEPGFLPKAFEAFQQENGTSSRAYTGLGLGLAIAKHIVEQHHGAILLASPGPGQGAQAIVRLPVRQRFQSGGQA